MFNLTVTHFFSSTVSEHEIMKNEKTVMSNNKPIGFFLDLFFDGWVKNRESSLILFRIHSLYGLCDKLKLYSNIYKQLFWAKCVILSNLNHGHFKILSIIFIIIISDIYKIYNFLWVNKFSESVYLGKFIPLLHVCFWFLATYLAIRWKNCFSVSVKIFLMKRTDKRSSP